MRLVDLSHTIIPGMPQWPGDRQPLDIIRHSVHGPSSHMSSALALGCHVGTHIDAPLHFRDGEPGIDALPLEAFWGRAVRLECGDPAEPGPLGPEVLAGVDLQVVDFVLFDTGWARFWGAQRYYREWPFLGEELAEALAAADLKGVGLDTPSLDPFGGHRAHDVCAAAGLINLENLANLRSLPPAGFLLMALPLKLQGTEASPVRAVGVLETP